MPLFRILRFLPLRIQRLPYLIALWSVRIVFADLPIKIWPRNSFILNTLVCALSDLDLTFYAYRPCNIYPQLWRYRTLKILFPFLGEINFYFEDKLKKFHKYANYYELQRDPALLSRVGTLTSGKSDYEKFVFFLKILESDRKNLTEIPSFREKKWLLHFSRLGWEAPVISLSQLRAFLESELSKKGIESKVFLKCFFELDSKSKEGLNQIYEECTRKGLIKEYILLYPFHWIGSAFYHDSFEHDLELLSNLSENESKLLAEQFRWELWGLFTQLEVTPNKPNLLMHLDNIKKLIANIGNQEIKNETLEAVDTLSSLVDASLEHYKV